MKFRASEYKDYNIKLGLDNYGYLHRLLDLLFRLRERYNIYDSRLYYWSGEDEKQAEVLDCMYFDIKQRILIHKQIFKELWGKRHKNIKYIVVKQLKLW